MTFRPFFAPLLGIVALAVTGSSAIAETLGQPKAVVELFTSQGCSSCPPADALLTSLAERGDVVALAYHVDYWDYVGWTDTFGNEAYSDRQRAYAKSWGSTRIYTPQMVVNGEEAVVGSRRGEVEKAVGEASLALPIELAEAGGMLKITIPAEAAQENAVVWLVSYLDRAEVAIDRGDNAGKSMIYTQVVTDRQMLGMWESETGATIKLPLSGLIDEHASGVAVLVQQESNGLPGEILGAATYHP